MVQQVPLVGILMMVHGGMVSLMGLLYAVLGPTMFFAVQMDKSARPDDKTIISVMSIAYIGCGLLVLVIGVLHLIAGFQCMRFRTRMLVMTTLFCNIPLLFTCYCAPTGVAMAVYGLIVMFQPDVAEAFAMAARGASPDQIKDAFASPRRYGPPGDYDDHGRDGQDHRDRLPPDTGHDRPVEPNDHIQPS
jgi:hypothetical protein